MTDDDDILAAELALGLIEPIEAANAHARHDTDAAFTTRVQWWHEQFAPLAVDAATAPRDSVWAQIAASLPANDNSRALARGWRAAALSAMLLAATLAGVLVLRPAPVATQPELVVASLVGTAGAPATLAYERQSGQLIIVPAKFELSGRAAELWIIPAEAKPISLGVIDPAHTSKVLVPIARRAPIRAGASFAITLEPAGGSPTGLPTGPVIGAGIISGA
jgi:anti-sigma-K factor RskA